MSVTGGLAHMRWQMGGCIICAAAKRGVDVLGAFALPRISLMDRT